MYTWSKHHEFLKFLDLPSRTVEPLELALSSCEAADRQLLTSHGWRVRDALAVSRDILPYRDYISGSRGEFTVAKDQNIRLRTGWFSDRSACYLASGRPVIMQDTGLDRYVPTGVGFLTFDDLDTAADRIRAVEGDLARNAQAARAFARDHLDSDRVLPRLLELAGL